MFFCIFLQSTHQEDMKNVVECWNFFLPISMLQKHRVMIFSHFMKIGRDVQYVNLRGRSKIACLWGNQQLVKISILQMCAESWEETWLRGELGKSLSHKLTPAQPTTETTFFGLGPKLFPNLIMDILWACLEKDNNGRRQQGKRPQYI